MAQNITLMGASYSAVPAVTLPKTGGGTASFTDVSDTTATADDVASGTYFYTSAGVRTEGTASGGGGGPYVVGVVEGGNFRASPVINQAGATVTVYYTGTSSKPLPPMSQLVVADVGETVLIVLKSGGILTVGETFTFTMPSENVVVMYSGGM